MERIQFRYKISDDLNITHIPMKRFLSHQKTKRDLTLYLYNAILKHNMDSSKLVVASAGGTTRCNKQHLQFQNNNHEEADTLMVCLAATAAQRCPDAQLIFFSPDTDVLVLVTSHFPILCKNTTVSVASNEVHVVPF